MHRFALVGLFALTAAAQPIAPANPGRSIGQVMARVSVEVFSDYQCPYCRELYFKVIKPLIADYARSNKIYLVHREFPLQEIHPFAKEAACYACAAGRVGKYEQVCESLFRDQDSWAKSGKVAESACAGLTAEEAKRVRALAHDASIAAEIDSDIQLGKRAGVTGTPRPFVHNGARTYPLPYDVSYSLLTRFIEQQIAAR
jgi:protein-disulfide isomerase